MTDVFNENESATEEAPVSTEEASATTEEASAAPAAKLTNQWTGPVAEDATVEQAEDVVEGGDEAAESVASEAAESQSEEADAGEVIDEDALLADDDDDDDLYLSPYDRPGKWFVLHTQSGYEKKVKQNLEARIASMNMESRIHEVVIPTREIPEFKNGKKVMTEKKLFPGYLLCRTQLDDDAWYVIRNTPGVTGFVNQGGKPSPMRRRDVENFLGVEADRKQEATKKSKPMFEYDMGETVRVKEGPFADFSGEIIEINEDQLKVKVLVNIFGRETPVELEFAQVARL